MTLDQLQLPGLGASLPRVATVVRGYANSVTTTERKKPGAAIKTLGIAGLVLSLSKWPVLAWMAHDALRAEDAVVQTSFVVVDAMASCAIAVVLWRSRGGALDLTDNDQVVVGGHIDRNTNALRASYVLIIGRAQYVLSPPALILGQ